MIAPTAAGGTRDRIARALLAVAAGDREGAVHHARAAAGVVPADRLAEALVRHLTGGAGDVYADPAAFGRFIDGGGNVRLYAEARRALAAVHERERPGVVLDIGCGDGRLTVAAARPGVERIEVVEPSAELLAAARARLAGVGPVGPTVVPFAGTTQAFVDAAADRRWDVAQSTFALHALPPADRRRVLAFLARRVRRLAVVEFDVPAFPDRGPEHAAYAAERYEAGVAEYVGDDLAVDGFLLPVLVGQFDPTRPRHTWEQPAAGWVEDLRAAGFTDVTDTAVADYWWAPAHLLQAVNRTAR